MIGNGFKYFYVLFAIVVVLATYNLSGGMSDVVGYDFDGMNVHPTSPYSLQVYNSIEKYSKQYNVPKYIAYNIAFLETTYQGPFDWRYHGKLISCVGAKGPMQIMPKTANWITGKNITQKELLHNIDLNVKISMELLHKLSKQYKYWAVICGYYNTGYPKCNDYALFFVIYKDYQKNWVGY